MASKTITDKGIDGAAVIFERRSGQVVCDVYVRDSTGMQHTVTVPLAGTLTGPEAAALPGVLLKLYNAALTSLGFA